jgi:hypothetical protein
MDAATLLAKLDKQKERDAWLREIAPSVEEMKATVSAMSSGARWFSSTNVIDFCAVKRILKDGETC